MTWRQLHTTLFAYYKKRQDKQPPQRSTDIPLEIKELLAKKRKARAKWQRSHAPSDKMTYNRLSNNLKSKLRAMRTNSFENYVSTLNRYNSIWKPIKTSRKTCITKSPLRINSPTQNSWRQSNKEKADTFAKHLADEYITRRRK